MVVDNDTGIIHLPELHITKDRLREICEKHFGKIPASRDELISENDEKTCLRHSPDNIRLDYLKASNFANKMEEIRKLVKEVLSLETGESKLNFPDMEVRRIAKVGNLDISRYNTKELAMGYEVEKEHGTVNPTTNVTNDDEVKTLKIAIAHLNEVPDYYTKLAKFVENKNLEEAKKRKKVNPWAVCTSKVGRSDKDKYERCVMGVKKSQGIHKETEVVDEKSVPKKQRLPSGKKKKLNECGCPNQENEKSRLIIKDSADNMSPDKIKLTIKFIASCLRELGINKPVSVFLTGKRGGPIKTTASFDPDSNNIWVYTKNRNMLGDILRSIAHEIRHFKQNLDGAITDESGKDGSEHENEANSFSGLMIRKFGRENPAIYQ